MCLPEQPHSIMKSIPDNTNTKNRASRNNSLAQDVEAISSELVCVRRRLSVGWGLWATPVSGRCASVCVCWLWGSCGGVWFCAKELIKVTFISDAWGSEGSFGTCVCGAKLTVNTNNQSAGPIEYWRQSNRRRRRGPGPRPCLKRRRCVCERVCPFPSAADPRSGWWWMISLSLPERCRSFWLPQSRASGRWRSLSAPRDFHRMEVLTKQSRLPLLQRKSSVTLLLSSYCCSGICGRI